MSKNPKNIQSQTDSEEVKKQNKQARQQQSDVEIASETNVEEVKKKNKQARQNKNK